MNQNREELIFGLAFTKPANERAAFLDRECGADKALRQRLDALLAAHDEPDKALDKTEAAVEATMKIEFAAQEQGVSDSEDRTECAGRQIKFNEFYSLSGGAFVAGAASQDKNMTDFKKALAVGFVAAE